MGDTEPLRPAREEEARWWRDRGERELRQILCWRWDPIGVQNDLPYSEGEYDTYAPRVLAALRQWASAREIAALLATIERREMGIRSEGAESAAQLIVDWYAKSRSYWPEFERDH